MKLAFVSTLYWPNELGGAERTVRTLAEELVRHGHEATVISLAPDGQASSSVHNGVRTHYVPLANVYWPFRKGMPPHAALRGLWHLIDAYNPVMGHRIGKILDVERPDVVQTGNLLGFSVAAWSAASKRGIPLVQMLHDYYLACVNSSMFRHGDNCTQQCSACHAYGTAKRRLSNQPTAVISLSRRTLEKVESCGLFTAVPTKAIIHGASNLDLPAVQPPRGPRDVLTLGYLGRVEKTKGIEVLLDAAAKLGARRVRALIAGSGTDDYMAELKARYDSPAIEFVGFVKPADLFARIDLLVVPSLWEEPLGRVIYEAYTYGVPSAVSRSGGMPEIVDEGRTGFVFDTGNADSLAAAIEKALADWDGERMAAACRAKSQEFNMDHLFSKYLTVWEGARAQRQGAGQPGALVSPTR